MRNEEAVLKELTTWAGNNDHIRGMVLTSSRVVPGSKVDLLSDYDIELYVSDLAPFIANDEWLEFFGPILVRWPYKPRSTMQSDWITRLVLFQDGVRVDFQITSIVAIDANQYENGYRVLLDKDNLLNDLTEPTYTEFLVKMPSSEEYQELVNEFWWDVIYVPKYLWRNEFPFAKYMLDHTLRHCFLHPMIEWYIGTLTNWRANPGVWGRKFKHYLDSETWWQLESTYAGADLEENWDALYAMLALFSRLGQGVGNTLGYEYPAQLEADVRRYVAWIKEL